MPKAKNAKKKKDPNKPRRNKSAYLFFAQEHRPLVKADLPGATFGDIGREVGMRWKAIKDSKSADKYKSLAAKDKVRYTNEMKAYVPPESENPSESEDKPEVSENRKPNKKSKSKGKVKKKVNDSDNDDFEDDAGVLCHCVFDPAKKKVRVRVEADGFDISKWVAFPRKLRIQDAWYLVPEIYEDKKGFYRCRGEPKNVSGPSV
jgi:hypothetical protein